LKRSATDSGVPLGHRLVQGINILDIWQAGKEIVAMPQTPSSNPDRARADRMRVRDVLMRMLASRSAGAGAHGPLAADSLRALADSSDEGAEAEAAAAAAAAAEAAEAEMVVAPLNSGS
jgi:hypothetical protein